MILMVGVNIINIVLNPILIFGLGGIPAFGIAGSALATILSRGAGLVVGMLLLGTLLQPHLIPENLYS